MAPTSRASNENLGVDMEVDYEVDPGRVSIETTLSGKLGVTTSDAFAALRDQATDPSMTVRYRLARGPQAQLENATSNLISSAGLPGGQVITGGGSGAGDVIPQELQEVTSDPVDLWTGVRSGALPVGNTRVRGTDPASVERVFSWQPLNLRLPQSVLDRVNDLPDLRLEVIARPADTGVQRFFGGDVRTTISIPASAFIEAREPREISCSDRYPEIEQAINGISTEVDALLTERDLLSEIGANPGDLMVDGGFFSGVRDTVSDAVGGGVTGDEDTNVFGSGGITGDADTSIVGGGITRDADTSITEEGFTGDEDTSVVGGGITGDADTNITEGGLTGDEDTNVIDEGFTRDEGTNVFGGGEDEVVEPSSGFSGGGDDAFSGSTQPEPVSDSEFQDAIRPDVEVDGPEPLDLEGTFFEKMRQLLTELNSLQSRVSTEVDVAECRQKYNNILGQLEQLIRDALNLQERVIDCASEYSGLNSRINSFEASIGNVRTTDPGDIRDAINEASDLQSEVTQRVDNNECVQEFRDRINGAIDRLQNFEGGINCIDEYNDIDERIEDIRDWAFDLDPDSSFRSLPPLREVTSKLEEARSIREDLINRVDEPDCLREFRSRIQGAISRLENLRETAKVDCTAEFPQLNREVKSVVDTAERLRTVQNAGETVSVRDAEGLRGSINSVRDQIERLSDVERCRSEFRTKVEDASSILENQLDPQLDLDCDDVASDIRTQTEQIRQEAADFPNLVPREGTLNNARQLLSDARDLRDRIENEVRDENPCKSQLTSDISTAIQRLQSFSEREPVPVSCSEKFPELASASKDLQRRASDFRGVVQSQEVLTFIQDAQEIQSRIEEEIEEGDRCRSELLSRAEAAVRRAQSATGGLRTIGEGEAGDLLPGIEIEELEGDLTELEGPSLEEIRSRIEETQSQ